MLLEWLTRIAGKTHASTGTLFCMEWRATSAALVQEWYYLLQEMSSQYLFRRLVYHYIRAWFNTEAQAAVSVAA